ncbi:Uncharacterised protein [uncultured archaeon]|nr:Uncharacterised protein [uncultured archaeon]
MENIFKKKTQETELRSLGDLHSDLVSERPVAVEQTMSLLRVMSHDYQLPEVLHSIRSEPPQRSGMGTLIGRTERMGSLFNSYFAGYSINSGTGPQPTDTRGMKTNDPAVFQITKGHAEGAGNEGEVSLKHKGDTAVLGSKTYPTAWRVIRRHRDKDWKGSWNAWTTSWDKTYTLNPGETQSIVCDESDSGEDVDIYITLLSVGKTQEEVDVVTKDKADADQALANANAQLTALKAKGGDTTAVVKLVTAAKDAYAKADYPTATSSAKQATSIAIDAIALIDKNALDAQKAQVVNDPSLTAQQKADMVKNIEDQKAKVDINATTAKEQTGAPKFVLGLNLPTVIIFGTIFTVIGGIVAVVASKKK